MFTLVCRCGHCKNLAPVYEKLGAVFDGDAAVSITRVDADKYKDIGQRFKVQGFPTLFWIPAGKVSFCGRPHLQFIFIVWLYYHSVTLCV